MNTLTPTELKRLELVGQRTGHALCRCPACGEYRLCAYRPPSQRWPVCHTCAPKALAGANGRYPRFVPTGDVTQVRKNPGKARTKQQLREDGYR